MILSILTLSVMPSYAGTENGVVVLTMFQQSKQDDNDKSDLEKEGRRKPTHPITIYIDSESGVTIPGHNTEDILGYEILTVDGDPVASFVDEEDFITFIFSAEGTYEIRLQFEEVTLKGYIDL